MLFLWSCIVLFLSSLEKLTKDREVRVFPQNFLARSEESLNLAFSSMCQVSMEQAVAEVCSLTCCL